MVEKLFSSFFVQGDISELVADDQIIVQEALFQSLQLALCLRLAYIRKKVRNGGSGDYAIFANTMQTGQKRDRNSNN